MSLVEPVEPKSMAAGTIAIDFVALVDCQLWGIVRLKLEDRYLLSLEQSLQAGVPNNLTVVRGLPCQRIMILTFTIFLTCFFLVPSVGQHLCKVAGKRVQTLSTDEKVFCILDMLLDLLDLLLGVSNVWATRLNFWNQATFGKPDSTELRVLSYKRISTD